MHRAWISILALWATLGVAAGQPTPVAPVERPDDDRGSNRFLVAKPLSLLILSISSK